MLEMNGKQDAKAGDKRQDGELFIVDNSDAEWKVKNYLREWTDIAHAFDIATGYFEISTRNGGCVAPKATHPLTFPASSRPRAS